MKPVRCTNSEARDLVIRKYIFKTNNETIFSEHRSSGGDGDLYVVYSYGRHFPMYVYDYVSQEWYGNQDKYSRTTSAHQSKCRPPNVVRWFSTEELKTLIYQGGIAQLTIKRMEDAVGQT